MPFATNFNPEINIREITQKGRYWENGEWVEIEPMSVDQEFDFPGVGERKAYLLYHEELESLVQNIPGLKRIRFWMTFGEEYLTHLRVLENVGHDQHRAGRVRGHADRAAQVSQGAAARPRLSLADELQGQDLASAA